MRKIQRLSAVGALAALTMTIAACSSSEEASTGSETTTAASGSSSSAAPSSSSSSAATSSAASGVTQISDIFGPACDQVPTSGPGSAAGMVADPVGTAASNNPLLSTLTSAVGAAGLVEALNDTSMQYTVFAPINSAFEALPPGTLDTLLADPSGQLTTILTYHVIPERYDAAGLVEAGSVTSLQGGDVEITGTADAPVINGDVDVACGNIPTANATVFAIPSVLMPPSA